MNKKLPFIVGGAVIVAVFGIIVFILTTSGNAGQKDTTKYIATDVSRQKAPDFTARDIYNVANISLKAYAGKVVLLNFWATWCPPCRLEIPGLVSLSKKYKDKFTVIGVSVDQDGPAVVKKFYQENKMNFPVIMATKEIIAAYGGITAIPTSFLIDKTGKVADTIVGYRAEEQYEEMIKANF